MSAVWQIRLQRDLKELHKEPLRGIQVHAHPSNIQQMCLILSPPSGAFSGFRLHFDVRIPDRYPQSPPIITIQTPVPHPNVLHGGYLCCDILREPMYTPAYLLKYVFLQLLSFFTSNKVEQEYGYSVDLKEYAGAEYRKQQVERAVQSFSCNSCGFNISIPSVVDRALEKQQRKLKKLQITRVEDRASPISNPFESLDLDCFLEIMDRLRDEDVIRFTEASRRMKHLVEYNNVLIRRQLVCFFLRKNFSEPGTILGVGVNCCDKKPFVAVVDLFSKEAFDQGLRKGIIDVFTHFLPVAFNERHFLQARSLIYSSLSLIDSSSGSRKNSNSPGVVSPVLRTLPALMNQMVLRLVDSCDKERDESRDRDWMFAKPGNLMRASEKALQGYCLLFHLFSKLVRTDKALASEIQSKVENFIRDIKFRGKDCVPDLGEFLTYVLVAPEGVDWSKVARSFVEELLARSVLWIFDSRPYLAYMEPENYPSEIRLKDMFEAKTQGLRLFMFQVSFFHMTRAAMGDFDRRYGFPSSEMSSGLLQRIKDIYNVGDYYVFMKVVGAPLDERSWKWEMIKALREAIVSSERRKYHVVRYQREDLYVLRRRVEPQVPPPGGVEIPSSRALPSKQSFFPQQQQQQQYNQRQHQHQQYNRTGFGRRW